MAAAVIAGLTGCAAAHVQIAARLPRLGIPADKPPSPATWPKYPHFSPRSCSGRSVDAENRPGEEQFAPSYAPATPAHRTSRAEVIRRFLARFGDRRYIRSITFPASTNGRPLGDRLSAAIRATHANDASGALLDPKVLTRAIADWEAALAFGALRDDFCAAGGASLAGGTGAGGGFDADEGFALEQRFPNPSPAAFRRRTALIGERFGFHVVSLRLLRPEQIAPLLIVKTSRDRKSFARDVPAINELLNPTSDAAETFEGFYFAAEDARGPFLFTYSVFRGQVVGGQWAASEDLDPYPHGGGAASS